MAPNNAAAANKALKIQRQQAALELRRAGQDFREIARRVGCSKSAAHRYVKAALEGAIEQIATEATELKAEEISRLDGMLAGLWGDARKGDVAAVDRVLRIMERRSKLLGLDAPVKLAHTGKDGGPILTRNDGLDLGALTDDELRAYEAIARAAEERRGDRGGVAAPAP
jgi:transposase-like protein